MSSWELEFWEAEKGRRERADPMHHRILRDCALMRRGTVSGGAQEIVFATDDEVLIGFLEASKKVRLSGRYNQQAICHMGIAGTVTKMADAPAEVIRQELKRKVTGTYPYDPLKFCLSESEKAERLKSIETGTLFCFIAEGDYSYSVYYR